MSARDAVRHRLQEISATAALAAEAIGGAVLDFLPAELERFARQLDAVAGRLEDVCERLAVGVDPQRDPEGGAIPGAARRGQPDPRG
jgi:hypothetical protein